MLRESEKLIERKLKAETEKRDGLCLKLYAQFFRGLPDRLVLLPGGIVYFVETKSTGDSPRKFQEYVHNKLRKLGFKVFICDSLSKIADVFDMYDNRQN